MSDKTKLTLASAVLRFITIYTFIHAYSYFSKSEWVYGVFNFTTAMYALWSWTSRDMYAILKLSKVEDVQS